MKNASALLVVTVSVAVKLVNKICNSGLSYVNRDSDCPVTKAYFKDIATKRLNIFTV
jgi:hypothetical protein